MLGKVLKYDMRATGRVLLPVYAALFGAALLFGLSLGALSDSQSLFQILTGVIYAAVIVAVVVITIVMIISRFYHSMMGEEGYLTHVLPVGTGTLIAGKTISASLWSLFGTIAGLLSAIVLVAGALITAYALGNLDFDLDLSLMIQDFFRQYGGHAVIILIEGILVILAGSAAAIGRVYTAISVGHLWSNHRIAGAILVYIGIGIVLETVGMSALLGASWFPEDFFEKLLGTGDIQNVELVMLVSIIASLLLTAIYSVISWLVLKKHLNLQ